jgi:hypothetical protein
MLNRFDEAIKEAYFTKMLVEDEAAPVQTEGSAIELTDKSKSPKEIQEAIRKVWPDGIKYKGKEFFDAIYMKILIPFAQKELNVSKGFNSDGQECYLGYLQDKDVFISGWDRFEGEEIINPENDEDEYGTAEYEEPGINICFIRLDSNLKPSIAPEFDDHDSSGMFYNEKYQGYNLIKEMFANRIDLRLD